MEILGVGPLELIVILLIAMIIFGPDRLPEMGAKLGKGLRSLRRATRDFSREIEATRQAVEAPWQEITQPVQEVRDSVREIAPLAAVAINPQQAIREAIMADLKGTQAAPESQDGASGADSAGATDGQIVADAGLAANADGSAAASETQDELATPVEQTVAEVAPAEPPVSEEDAVDPAPPAAALDQSHEDDPTGAFDPGI